MDTELLIALIAGSTGVVLALLSLMMSLLARFSASRAASEVERLRQDITQRQSADWMKDQELETKLTAPKLMSEGIQRVMNEITHLLHAGPETPAPGELLQSVSAAGRLFNKLADEHGGKLGDVEQQAIGQARDAAVKVVVEARRVLESVAKPAEMSHKDREVITRLRTELSEAQMVLRGRMLDRLIARSLRDLKGGG